MIDPPVVGGASVVTSPNTVNPDPVAAAHQVLSTGGGGFLGIGKDYDSRVTTLSDALSQGDANYRAAVMKEIFKEDPNALQWLVPSANKLAQEGKLPNEAQIAESLAAAYNSRDLPQQTSFEGQAPYTAQNSFVTGTPLDQLVHGFSGPGGVQNQAQAAQNVREFLDFLDSSRGPEATQFRIGFADHLLGTYVAAPNSQSNTPGQSSAAVQFNHPDQSSVAAALAAHLLSEASVQNPNAATSVLSKYTNQLPQILQSAEHGGTWMTLNNITVNSDGRIIQNVQVSSAVPDLMQAVAMSPENPTNDAVALAFARLPATTPGLFNGPNTDAQANTDNLGQLFTTHFHGIMDTLTAYKMGDIGVGQRGVITQYDENVAELGSLLNVTMFNPKSAWAHDLQTMYSGYVGTLKAQFNALPLGDPGIRLVNNRMGMMAAAADDALVQRYNQIQAQNQSTKDTVAFIANLALAGVPVGDMAKDKVASLIASAFGDHAGRISQALTGVSKSLIGTGTDQLSSDAQAALVNALGANTSQFLTQQQATSALKESFFTGLNKDDTALESLIGSIESNIADARKQGSTSGTLQGG